MQDLKCCGTCVWWHEMPKPEKYPINEEWKRKGFCYRNPPAVYPMPKQTQTLGAMGRPGVQTLSFMMRPILEHDDDMCGEYAPTMEAYEALKAEMPTIDGGEGLICDGTCGDKKCDGCG